MKGSEPEGTDWIWPGIAPGLLILPVGWFGGLTHPGIYVAVSIVWIMGCSLWRRTPDAPRRTLDGVTGRLLTLIFVNAGLLAVVALIFGLGMAGFHG